MIDIGVSLLHPQFDSDRDAVLARALAAGVTGMLITPTDLEMTAAAIEFCSTSSSVQPGIVAELKCTAGIHPHNARHAPPDLHDRLEDLARSATLSPRAGKTRPACSVSAPSAEELPNGPGIEGPVQFLGHLTSPHEDHRQALTIALHEIGLLGDIDYPHGLAGQFWHTEKHIQGLFAEGAVIGAEEDDFRSHAESQVR